MLFVEESGFRSVVERQKFEAERAAIKMGYYLLKREIGVG